MTDRFRIGLKSFEISSRPFNLSLSMTSTAFIYHAPPRSATSGDLSSLIQSKQLWLLPRGLCRLDVYVQLPECDVRIEEPVEFLEFLADTICQSSLWSQLGLAIGLLDIQYHSEEDNIPSLYFSIEQPDMSAALLSPPHAYTAQFKGLECILRFNPSQPSSHSMITPRVAEHVDPESPLPSSWIGASTGASTGYFTGHAPDLAKRWEIAAYLVEAALDVMLGMRKRVQGVTISELEEAPSLLSLAPAIWNSHYLKCTASHAKNFNVISNILASSVNGQSPELRRKGAGLLKDSPPDASNGCSRETADSATLLESCIQQRLWDLLRTTLKPTMGTGRNVSRAILPKIELGRQDYEVEVDTMMIDHGGIDQHRFSYENNYPYGNLSPPSSQTLDDYQADASYMSNLEYILLEGNNDISQGSRDEELYEAPESRDVMDHSYSEARPSGSQQPQSYNPQHRSDLLNMPQDYYMLDWVYDGDAYDCSYSYADATMQGVTGSQR